MSTNVQPCIIEHRDDELSHLNRRQVEIATEILLRMVADFNIKGQKLSLGLYDKTKLNEGIWFIVESEIGTEDDGTYNFGDMTYGVNLFDDIFVGIHNTLESTLLTVCSLSEREPKHHLVIRFRNTADIEFDGTLYTVVSQLVDSHTPPAEVIPRNTKTLRTCLRYLLNSLNSQLYTSVNTLPPEDVAKLISPEFKKLDEFKDLMKGYLRF